jgi:hypothetical protein
LAVLVEIRRNKNWSQQIFYSSGRAVVWSIIAVLYVIFGDFDDYGVSSGSWGSVWYQFVVIWMGIGCVVAVLVEIRCVFFFFFWPWQLFSS